jgi:hypothetical protein
MTGLHEVTGTTIFYRYFEISSEWNWKALLLLSFWIGILGFKDVITNAM